VYGNSEATHLRAPSVTQKQPRLTILGDEDMFRFLLLALFVAFASAFHSPMAARSQLDVSMNEAPKAPKSGYTLTMAGGQRTVADVYAAQKKAAKAEALKNEVELDIKRTQKGWTTQ